MIGFNIPYILINRKAKSEVKKKGLSFDQWFNESFTY